MDTRYEIRLAGEGGQGLILAGIILAEAAALYDNQHVVQTQAYGPQVRGGVSRSEVVISPKPIDYPLLLQPNLLLALSQEALDCYQADLKRTGLILIDASQTKRPSKATVVQAPILELAREATGATITANMISLGLIAGITEVVSKGGLENAIRGRVPQGTVEINLRALAAGFHYAGKL